MPPKGPTKLAPRRLPPLPTVRVRQPNKPKKNPCTIIMSSLLSCWASSGYTAEGCVVLETQLRACMDQPKSKDQPPNNINYHISRLYPLISGPRKKKT